MNLATLFLGIEYAHPVILADGPWLQFLHLFRGAINGGAAGINVSYARHKPETVAKMMPDIRVPWSMHIGGDVGVLDDVLALGPRFVEADGEPDLIRACVKTVDVPVIARLESPGSCASVVEAGARGVFVTGRDVADAARVIRECRQAAPEVPIIGMGGVRTGEDAVHLIRAGATLVALDQAYAEQGPRIFTGIAGEMVMWGVENGVASVTELIGK